MNQMELETKLFQMMRGMLLQMVDEINPDDFQRTLAGGGNSPNWILGHLAIANLMGLATLGQPDPQTKALAALYGPGTQPTEDASAVPSKSELIDTFNRSADLLVAAAQAASLDQLAALRESTILKEQLPSVSDLIGHLLTTHFSLHIGQLSAWRRFNGMNPVLQF